MIFLSSSALLVLELTLIRWLPAHLRMLSYFANYVLLACFLGMSLGLRWKTRRSTLVALLPAMAALAWGLHFLDLGIQLDAVESTSSLYFGSEYLFQKKTNLPFHVVLIPTFLVCLGLMALPARHLGRLLDDTPNLAGYAANLLGSVFGVLVFNLTSYFGLGPVSWAAFLCLYVLAAVPTTTQRVVAVVSSLALLAGLQQSEYSVYWSPYNRITVAGEGRETELSVNGIVHQKMIVAEKAGFYDYPYLLYRRVNGTDVSGKVLVIGAGSGNDVASALRVTPAEVDAVEIDPVIHQLGRRFHPQKPYDSPRVHTSINDGRVFLHNSPKQYSWITFANVDSLSLMSQFGTVRLENYLFTRQSLQDARKALKDDGVLTIYNYFRQTWLVVRYYRELEGVFGKDNVMLLLLPPREKLDASQDSDIGQAQAILMAGNVAPFRDYLDNNEILVRKGDGTPNRLVPVKEMVGFEEVRSTTDDWPFPYLRYPHLPLHNLQSSLVVLAISLLALAPWTFVNRRHGRSQLHFFCLGVGFMLVETICIARFALLFGSTWVSNSLAILGILLVSILATLLAWKQANRIPRPSLLYVGLFLGIAVNLALPFDSLLQLEVVPRTVLGIATLCLPIVFSGQVFALSLAGVEETSGALAANLLGAMVGGCLENLSTVLGFRSLLWLVALAYLGSMLTFRREAAPTE